MIMVKVLFLIFVVVFGCSRIMADVHAYNALSLKDLKAASLAVKAASEVNLGDKSVLTIAGSILIRQGRISEGIDALERYTAVYPYDFNALANLGVAYLLADRIADADRIRKRVEVISPECVKYIQIRRKQK
jgi:Flp pilus assembly protein TadD